MLGAIIPVINRSRRNAVPVGAGRTFWARYRAATGLAADFQITEPLFALERGSALLTKPFASLLDADSTGPC